MNGPFKSAYGHYVNLWSMNHPGQPASIDEIAGFVNAAVQDTTKP